MEFNTFYIPSKLLKKIIFLLSLVSMTALILMDYDFEYKCIIILPVCYMISFILFINKMQLWGIGSIALVVMYAFRMCILPVLCAYGNFYLEPNKSIYMEYFLIAILLMCIECFIIFATQLHYIKKYQNEIEQLNKYKNMVDNEFMIILFAIVAFLFYSFIIYTHPGFLLAHYYFLGASEDDVALAEMENNVFQNMGPEYYLTVILDITFRPILSFALVDWLLKKRNKCGIIIAFLIGVFNVVWISDRRIISLLVGLSCMTQVLINVKNKITRQLVYISVIALAIITIYYCFLGEDTPLRIARKFQRYFSGPSLTAIGVAVYTNYIQTPIEFFKLLFNDSILLTGLFGKNEVKNYVIELCGPAGRSIWTPMFIGAIQYFHILAPLLLVIVVKYLVYTDYRAAIACSTLQRMMFNFLTISLSVYMIMYSLELVYYNMVFIGGLFYLLIFFNSRLSFVYSRRRRID